MGNKEKDIQGVRERCEDVLASFGRRVVHGRGSLDSPLVLVGEAPGAEEEKQGRPFVGKAGKNLEEFLKVLQWKHEEIYITNVVKIRPVRQKNGSARLSNRPPKREEIDLCLPYLLEELRIVAPRMVVSLGNVALCALTGNGKLRIGETHGRILPNVGQGFCVFPMYHPASMIYRPALKEIYYADMLELRRILTSVF